jgi:hypothetical protein
MLDETLPLSLDLLGQDAIRDAIVVAPVEKYSARK